MKKPLLPIAAMMMLGATSLSLTGCGSGGTRTHVPGAGGHGPVPEASTTATQSGAEDSLFAALNAARRQAGKPELKRSSELAGYARGETAAVAAGGKFVGDNTGSLRDRSSFGSIGKLHGQLTDRGAKTGAAFVDYWLKQNREMLEEDWSAAGVGISRTPQGQLVTVVLFGGAAGIGEGGMLMQPAR